MATDDKDRELAPDFYSGSNFLGRPTSIRLSGGEPGSQGGGALDAGQGLIPQGAKIPGSSPSGDKTSAPSGAGASIPSNSPSVLALLSSGMKLKDIISQLTSSGIPGWGDLGSEAWAGGVDQLATSGADAALTSSDAALSGLGALGAAAPIWAGLTAAVDFLGEGKFPFQSVIESLFGLNQPSKQWLSFAPHLRDTLTAEDTATTSLAHTLASSSPKDVPAAIAAWRDSIGKVVGGFGAKAGPLEIPDLPGATGKPHEGKLEVDFGPTTVGLRAMVDAALQGLSPEQRIMAFVNSAKQWQDAQFKPEPFLYETNPSIGSA